MRSVTISPPATRRPLISADRVAGTDVFDSAGRPIGEVRDVMIDKLSGQVAYAILSLRGFRGSGDRYYPVPWRLLNYDLTRGGYVARIDKDRLGDAPSFSATSRLELETPENIRWIYDYYGATPYWLM